MKIGHINILDVDLILDQMQSPDPQKKKHFIFEHRFIQWENIKRR